ncbi:MAG: cell envelope integrity protein TolA [Xanthomonadales bacterium]|nr:cell envelope integrity protein TolA [Xanthomonadales bacterium]MCC6596746.1 TonB C-terminal domain-containing protein [Rhodanobacteraceae bacterium]MDL1867984.1 cell envelope integrity protein TolA [Gammaproteobacteria bacterium PRO6]
MVQARRNVHGGLGADLRALALSLAVHALCVLVALVGLWWTSSSKPVVMPGPVIEATLVGPTAAPKRPRSAPPAASRPQPAPARPAPEPPQPQVQKPQPQPEPPKPETVKPTEVPKQDLVEQQRIAALAQQQAEQERKEQERKIRQQQVELQEAKERELREEQRRQLAEIQRQREAAEKKLRLEKERLAQIEDRNAREAAQAQPQAQHEAPQAQTGAGGADDDLTARYQAAIQAAVTNNWNRPESAQAGLRCTINVAQIPGGEVISVSIGSPCNADDVTRNSLEQAVKRAPLPYQGFEKVFQRNITFNFRYDG